MIEFAGFAAVHLPLLLRYSRDGWLGTHQAIVGGDLGPYFENEDTYFGNKDTYFGNCDGCILLARQSWAAMTARRW